MAINQIKAGAVLNYVIIGLNTLVGLLYTPFMLRCLGQNEYGLYSLVASVVAYLTILDFGFGNAIVRYTAKFRAEGKTHEQWELFGMFLFVYSVIGLIAFAGGMGLYFNVDALFDRTMTSEDLVQARTMMLFLTVNLAFTFPMSIFGSILTAYEKFVFPRIVNIVRILLSTAVMIALLTVGYKAVALVVVQTVFNVLTLVLNYIYAKHKLKIKIVFARFNVPLLKEISVYSFWIFLNSIMDKIYWGTGQFVLGSISGTVAVAVFSVAILLENMYMTFSTSICNVLLPRITGMVASNSSFKSISDLFIRTGRIQAIVMWAILAGFVVFGKGFISLWAGEGYALSYAITVIFFATLFTPLIQNTGIAILQARNQMKFRSLLYLGISVVSLAMQIVLGKRYGALGCAAAIGGALLLGQGLIMNIYYARCQHIDISCFWRQIGRLSVIPVLLMGAGMISWRFFDYADIYVLVSGIAVFAILFVFLMGRFGMNDYEKEIVLYPVKKIVKR